MRVPATNWPSQAKVDAFYGNPRGKSPDAPSAAWEVANLVRITPPYQMFYGDQPIKTIRVHWRCAEAMLAALTAIKLATKGDAKLLKESGASVYAGVYNYRLMRGGNRLSMHSWGCAIDLDPARNGLRDTTPNFANHPFIVRAFEDQGATWGGRWTGGSCDGMHFQFARV